MMHTSKSNSKKHNQQECVNSSNAILKRVAVLALPWAVLVATSLLLTAWETKWNGINDFMSSSDLSSSSSSSSSFVPRVLQQMTTSSSSHVQSVSSFSSSPPHHHHKPVYNEDHKPLFPLDASDQWGVFFAVLGLMIAAGGGVGGGGLLVPIFILVMGFTPKHAIPLSNITVFGGACANTLLNARKRHPQANRPLVDWDLILVMEPLTIAGALMGAFLNKLLPEELLTVLLVALLSYTSYETLKKAFKMYRKETQQMKLAGESELALMAQAEEHDADDEAAEELLKPVVDNDTPTTGETGSGTADKSADDGTPKKTTDDESVPMVESAFVMAQKRKLQQELEQILQGESVTPKENIYILLALFVVVLSINLLKGGGAFPSPLGIKCGSMPFWVANGLMLAWIVAITIYVRHHLVAKHERKLATGFVFLEGDIQWDTRATIVYPVICAAAGFFAGMFGVGGGIVKGPLMLAMGVHPAVSSATSACMILFTSFTATTSYMVFGLVVPDYSFVCVIVGFLATIVGQEGLSYIMKRAKAQRNSYIAFSIGFVVLLSAILMTFQSLMSLASGEKHHAGGICGKAT